MYNTAESARIAGDLAFHILYTDIDKLSMNEAEDKIACDILAGFLPPLTQEEVDLAFKIIKDLKQDLKQQKI